MDGPGSLLRIHRADERADAIRECSECALEDEARGSLKDRPGGKVRIKELTKIPWYLPRSLTVTTSDTIS